jgi:hypothetical protein
MKTSIELFNLYVEKSTPAFYLRPPENGKYNFCTAKGCNSCHIKGICDESTNMLPSLTHKQFESVKEEYPEFCI